MLLKIGFRPVVAQVYLEYSNHFYSFSTSLNIELEIIHNFVSPNVVDAASFVTRFPFEETDLNKSEERYNGLEESPA